MIAIERIRWDGADPEGLARRIRASTPAPGEAMPAVAQILDRVRDGGDTALRELAERFGEPVPEGVRVEPAEIAAAAARIEPEFDRALALAAENVEAVARAELAPLADPVVAEPGQGQRIEVRRSPIRAAGVYAPGGRGVYPSSVLMCAIPARVAGVGRIALATPPGPGGRPADPVLAACARAGVDDVYAVGGAQAIAALAFGTESIAPVEVIAGPGNRYVTEAKRLVSGIVAIDGLAGPSELVVVAGPAADADWIALDLCAQAEHGDDSPLAVLSSDADLLDRVEARVSKLAAERPSVAAPPATLIETTGIDAALAFCDAFAPEHLELAFEGASEVAGDRVAGCLFVGEGGAAAFGDYAAGSNHVLPTGGAARFGGPLGPGAFLRRSSVVTIDGDAARELAPHVAAIAQAEGFVVHGESAIARARTKK